MEDFVYYNSDREYHEIYDFLNRLAAADPHMYWESGRMNFWRYNVHANKKADDPFFRENVHFWRNPAGEIVGLCISEYGGNDIFIEVLPEYPMIYSDMLRWIEDVWAVSKPVVEIDVYCGNKDKIRLLESYGFSFSRHFENKRVYDLNEIDLEYELKEGFKVQAFSESMNYESRVALVHSAFNNPNVTENNIRSLMASPDYIDEYHLSLVGPHGQHVAYCIGWNETSRENWGFIEPVGTHASYRRMGFGKAIIRECFKRMKENGIHTAMISSLAEPAVSNFLYDSLSPKNKLKVFKYVKKLT